MDEKETLISILNNAKKIDRKLVNMLIKKFKVSKSRLFSFITFSEKYYEKLDGNKNN